jgi:hypothetical protein
MLKELVSIKVAAFGKDEADSLHYAGSKLCDPIAVCGNEPPNSPRIVVFFSVPVAFKSREVVGEGKRVRPESIRNEVVEARNARQLALMPQEKHELSEDH